MNNPEASNSNADAVSLIEQVRAATQSNPSLARELSTFLLDTAPDSQPVTKEQHPVFFDATKNPGTYHYVPKNGIGVHKDGTKLTAFDYEVSFHTRSKDFFGEDIESAKSSNDIYALEDIIISAYGDLVFTGNDDMTSYLYLCRQAIHALSDKVKTQIGHLQHKGGVALALVTELVATSSTAEELFKAAVRPRDDDTELSGIEAMNEANVVKVYTALTPSVQTKGILLNNGVDLSKDWAQELMRRAPNLDMLVDMDFDKLSALLPSDATSVSKTDQSVVHQMYAGMLGNPTSANVPPVRKYILESGLDLSAADKLEKAGYEDLSTMTDKDIYNTSSNISSNVDDLSGSFATTSKLIRAKQRSMNDCKLSGNVDMHGGKTFSAATNNNRRNAMRSMGNKLRGKQLGSLPRKMIGKMNGSAGFTNVASMLGIGGGAAAASGIGIAGGMAALIGPVSVALALAPVLNKIAEDNAQRLNENMAETSADRQIVAAEVSDLLARVSDLSTEEDAAKQQVKAEKLLNAVNKPGSFVFSKMQGMGLQRQPDALGTKFGPTNMAALPSFQSDAELVASIDSGRALSAVCIFLDDESISAPHRQLLQTPNYVKMMGVSNPFQTRTHRTTSEKESMAFVNSSSQTGFSMAEKTSSSSSTSSQTKAGGFFSRVKVKTSVARSKEEESKASYANDSKHKQEEKIKVTQVVVSEFTYMPMRTFSLSEGGLILSDYAYYRLQKIAMMKNSSGEDVPADTATKYLKALQFMIDFGSHIPFGVQTIGGVFVRQMKLTSRASASVTEMYSAASSQLTKTNTTASKRTTEVGGRAGIFGIGASANNSTSFGRASSNGETTFNSSSSGSGGGTQEVNASFQSSVTCYGPNAATQDMMYDQLMSNNATWTIIDRGEPGSYFPIWDLVDYIGQGGVLQEQCQLLREVWEGTALSKSISDNNDLLDIVMPNYSLKQNVFNFVDAIITCVVPTVVTAGLFTGALADQFGDVMRAAAKSQRSNGVKHDPTLFISAGFTGAGISAVDKTFEIRPGSPAYQYANNFMLGASTEDWAEFSYYTDIYRARILEKGKPNYLLNLFRTVFEDSKDVVESWSPLIKSLVDPPGTFILPGSQLNFDQHMERSLTYKDDITGWNCMHYVLFSWDESLITSVFNACPEAATMTNAEGQYPIDLAASNDDMKKNGGIYGHLFNLMFSGVTPSNLALNQPTEQSSTYQSCGPEIAVNGNKQIELNQRNISHTRHDSDPWWQVDLGGMCSIDSIIIYNRTGQWQKLLQGFRLEIFRNGNVAYIFNDVDDGSQTLVRRGDEITIEPLVFGDRVKISIPNRKEYLHLREVQVNGRSFGLVRKYHRSFKL